MTLDVSKPSDTVQVSELPTFIRENRTAINSVVGSDNFGVTELEVPAGTTSLAIGTELSTDGIEVVIISGTGLSDISSISGGSEGQIKIFIFQDTNIDMVDGNAKAGGVFYLNHLPAGSDFDSQQDDVLILANIGGDGGSTYGYWKEIHRLLSVK